MSETKPVEVVIHLRDEDTGAPAAEIGTVAIGPRAVLTLTEIVPGYEDLLNTIIDEINAMEEFQIKVPPPPGGDRYGIYAMTVDRNDTDYSDVIPQLLAQRYGLAAQVKVEPTV